MDDNYDPIQKEKTFLEKIWESVKGRKRKKIYITTQSFGPYKEQCREIGSYLSKDEEKVIKEIERNIADFGVAISKAGFTVNEARSAIAEKIKRNI